MLLGICAKLMAKQGRRRDVRRSRRGVVVFLEEMGIRTMENHGKIMEKTWENHDKTSDMM